MSTMFRMHDVAGPKDLTSSTFNSNRLEDRTYLNVLTELAELLKSADVDPGHGIEHVTTVAKHCDESINCLQNLRDYQKIALMLGGLLHDADDEKIFPNSTNYQNARKILSDVLPDTAKEVKEVTKETMIELVIEIIDLVSCRHNRNNKVSPDNEWKLIVRYCDRAEAIGVIGIVRCYQFTIKSNMKFYTENTSRAVNFDELWKIATPERFSN